MLGPCWFLVATSCSLLLLFCAWQHDTVPQPRTRTTRTGRGVEYPSYHAACGDARDRRAFLYLFQTAWRPQAAFLGLRSNDSDFICLTYEARSPDCALFLPESTWTTGRNALWRAAMRRRDVFRYYIFMDEDVSFVKGGFRELERILLKYEPALAGPRFEFVNTHVKHVEAEQTHHLDGAFNAFHCEVCPHESAAHQTLVPSVATEVAGWHRAAADFRQRSVHNGAGLNKWHVVLNSADDPRFQSIHNRVRQTQSPVSPARALLVPLQHSRHLHRQEAFCSPAGRRRFHCFGPLSSCARTAWHCIARATACPSSIPR